MRSRDEFKDLIQNKCTLEKARQKKRRRQIITTVSAFAICLTVCLAVLLSGDNRILPDDTPQTQASSGTVIDVSVMRTAITVEAAEPQGTDTGERHYTDENKTKAIIDFLDNLSFTEASPEQPSYDSGTTYIITVTSADGTAAIYTISGNGSMQINDGSINTMQQADLEELIRLFESLESD